MKAGYVMVYEIEHGGDEAAALEALAKAGCKNIVVKARDYEGAESILVACDFPDGILMKKDLEALCPGLCL